MKYRVPAADIYRLSLSPFLDNVAVFHIKSVCIKSNSKECLLFIQKKIFYKILCYCQICFLFNIFSNVITFY